MINLRQGDCLELMKDIPDKSIDMILCDLPYGTTACKWDIVIPFDKLWEQYKRIIKNDGTIVLFGSQPFTSELIHSNIKWFSHNWTWVKNKASNFQLANKMPMKITEDICVFYKSDNYELNNFQELRLYSKKILDYIGLNIKNINKIMGNRKAEHFFYWNTTQFSLCTLEIYNELIDKFEINKSGDYLEYKILKEMYEEEFKGRCKTYNPQGIKKLENPIKLSNKNKAGKLGHLSSISKRDEYTQQYTNYPTNVLKFNVPAKNIHPTQKPVTLLEYLIKTYTNENDTVLDNCMGSGSTGVACVNTNRNFIGIELSEEYYNIATERINNTVVKVDE